jgi:hypothetical protein
MTENRAFAKLQQILERIWSPACFTFILVYSSSFAVHFKNHEWTLMHTNRYNVCEGQN